ncbi:extracellular solute-binding protein [Cohnella boryungensis]|uniref:Extracellular solute-binding protein n=1 Tax=Cohnella boryungensis TaxID=768479 RepID=A0ABV8S5B8_9BACL
MRTAKKLRLGLCVCALVLLSSLAASCMDSGPRAELAETEEAPYAPYDPPIQMRIAYSYSDIQLPAGDLKDDNFLTRYVKDKTGISVKYEWEASGDEQYKSKLDLAIRSNDLPDVFIVNREQFRTLIEREMIQDLQQDYEAYASELVRSFYDATRGNALKEASVNDKLYGLPNVAIEADAPTYLWIRQDWLDKLNLSPPRSLDDLEKVAKAFMERDPDGNGKADTVGIPVDNLIVYADKTGVHGLNSVFSAHHAFPTSWIRDGNGEIAYGSVLPEAKNALARIASWYEEGIIDNDFVLRKDIYDIVELNRTGIVFGPWWSPFWPLSGAVAKDTKADWKVYAAPVDANGLFVTNGSPVTDRYLVVRKGYAHPEAAIKMLNFLTRIERNQDPNKDEVRKLHSITAQLGVQIRNYYPFDLLLDYPDAIEQRYDKLMLVLQGELDPEALDVETASIYQDIRMEKESPLKNMEAWSKSQAYLLGGEVSKLPKVKKESLFYGRTPTMEDKWAALQQLEHETYLKIITGELPIDAFDTFVSQWRQEGGDAITREVAEAVAGEK